MVHCNVWYDLESFYSQLFILPVACSIALIFTSELIVGWLMVVLILFSVFYDAIVCGTIEATFWCSNLSCLAFLYTLPWFSRGKSHTWFLGQPYCNIYWLLQRSVQIQKWIGIFLGKWFCVSLFLMLMLLVHCFNGYVWTFSFFLSFEVLEQINTFRGVLPQTRVRQNMSLHMDKGRCLNSSAQLSYHGLLIFTWTAMLLEAI